MRDNKTKFAARRNDDDDDDDDTPKRRSRDDEDDDDDDRPKKKQQTKKTGMSPLLIVGGVLGVLAFFGCCCGGGGLFYYYSGGNQVTITQVGRNEGAFNFGGAQPAPQIAVKFQCSSNFKTGQTVQVVAECGGRRSVFQMGTGLTPNAKGDISWTAQDLKGVSGPLTVYVEDNARKKISNTVTVP